MAKITINTKEVDYEYNVTEEYADEIREYITDEMIKRKQEKESVNELHKEVYGTELKQLDMVKDK